MPSTVVLGHPLSIVAKGSIAVGAAAVGIPASDLDKAQGGEIEVLLGVETDQVRISPNGVAATTTDMLFDVGDKIRLMGSTLCRQMTLIQVTGSATVRYWVFGKQVRGV